MSSAIMHYDDDFYDDDDIAQYNNDRKVDICNGDVMRDKLMVYQLSRTGFDEKGLGGKVDNWMQNKNTKCPIDAHCHRHFRRDPRIAKGGSASFEIPATLVRSFSAF